MRIGVISDTHGTLPALAKKALEGCGLVSSVKKGKWSHYSLNCDQWTAFRDYIESIRCASEENAEGVCCCS